MREASAILLKGTMSIYEPIERQDEACALQNKSMEAYR